MTKSLLQMPTSEEGGEETQVSCCLLKKSQLSGNQWLHPKPALALVVQWLEC